MTLHAEMRLAKQCVAILQLTEFLHRFLEAADRHVELEPFIVEGAELLRSINKS